MEYNKWTLESLKALQLIVKTKQLHLKKSNNYLLPIRWSSSPKLRIPIEKEQ